tara:strand:- start:29077 stop:30261 length:1185 start_codon:yes stop_codon:yes gene_type:complete
MKQKLLIILISVLAINCSGVKNIQEAINYGNYDQAIETSLKHLRNNKIKKSNQTYIFLLEEAFQKVTERDFNKIKFLKNDGNKESLENIYTIYTNLNRRQELIKPLLPLRILKKGRNAQFNFRDYSNDLINSKEELSEYLLEKAKNTLSESVYKIDFRNAYNDLIYLDEINPNYKNTRVLIDEAHFKGINFVFVYMKNKTNMVIPMRLEEDLLNFDTYRLNNLWTVFHNKKQSKQLYDFELELNLREILISPEQVREKIIVEEKQVKDGWKYLIDTNGNAVKDSLGKTIKVDNFKTIRSKVTKFTQFKSTQVVGQVKYVDLTTKQLVQVFPIASEFVFEHNYATYSGDKNAINKQNLGYLKYKYVPFPSNEQMIYDSGEDLKNKIKSIISNNNF